MRHLVLLAVLASACDQGATAAPPTPVPKLALEPKQTQTPPGPPAYVIRDDADFAAKAMALLTKLFAIFDQTNDCELLATHVEKFAGEHKTMFVVLTAYGRAHPEAEKTLQAELGPQVDKLVQKVTPVLTTCMQNQRLMTAFQSFAEDTQQLQQQQRPR